MTDRRIFKYEVNPRWPSVAMPKGARLLTADVQGGGIMLWAEVDVQAPPVDRRIVVAVTGGEVPDGTWLATVQIGAFVFHVYDGGE